MEAAFTNRGLNGLLREETAVNKPDVLDFMLSCCARLLHAIYLSIEMKPRRLRTRERSRRGVIAARYRSVQLDGCSELMI